MEGSFVFIIILQEDWLFRTELPWVWKKKKKHYPAAHAILHKQLWPVGMKHSLSKTSFHFQKKNKQKKALSQIIK